MKKTILFSVIVIALIIVAVICFNSFQSIVKRFEDDFQLIKLLFLSFVDSEDEPTSGKSQSIAL